METADQVYANLMAEAHVRIRALDKLVSNYQDWPPLVLEEFCYLQLRLLCEMIGLGCLIAHDDIKNRDLLGSWNIPVVMKKLEKLKPDFFPLPKKLTFPNGGIHVEPSTAPALTKDELFKLHAITGSKLHRGSAKGLLAELGTQKLILVDEITAWAKKIIHLLEQHVISSANGKRHWIVILSHADNGGRPSVFIAESP